MQKSKWEREPRKPPTSYPSDWQWYWGDNPGDIQPIIQELWPNRKYYPPGWWWHGPLEPRPPAPPKLSEKTKKP